MHVAWVLNINNVHRHLKLISFILYASLVAVEFA